MDATAMGILLGFGWLLSEVVTPLVTVLVAVGATCWIIARFIPARQALPLATVAVLALCVVVPLLANAKTNAVYARAVGPDVTPPERVALTGDIYLDRLNSESDEARSRPPRYSKPDYWMTTLCGQLCRALLATPGVTSVTVEPSHRDRRDTPSLDAVTYQRSDNFCSPALKDSRDVIDDDRAYAGRATTPCALGGPPIGRVGMRIVTTDESSSSHWLWNSVTVRKVELIDPVGLVLLRRTEASALVTDVPLRFRLHDGLHLELRSRDGPGTAALARLPRVGGLLIAHTVVAQT